MLGKITHDIRGIDNLCKINLLLEDRKWINLEIYEILTKLLRQKYRKD